LAITPQYWQIALFYLEFVETIGVSGKLEPNKESSVHQPVRATNLIDPASEALILLNGPILGVLFVSR
jgi:hypothetical protein